MESRRATAAAEKRVAFLEEELEKAAGELLQLRLRLGEEPPPSPPTEGGEEG